MLVIVFYRENICASQTVQNIRNLLKVTLTTIFLFRFNLVFLTFLKGNRTIADLRYG